jgi:hypothetical protein
MATPPPANKPITIGLNAAGRSRRSRRPMLTGRKRSRECACPIPSNSSKPAVR